MTLVQALLRRLSSQQVALPKAPEPLSADQLKAVAGGVSENTDSPRNVW